MSDQSSAFRINSGTLNTPCELIVPSRMICDIAALRSALQQHSALIRMKLPAGAGDPSAITSSSSIPIGGAGGVAGTGTSAGGIAGGNWPSSVPAHAHISIHQGVPPLGNGSRGLGAEVGERRCSVLVLRGLLGKAQSP